MAVKYESIGVYVLKNTRNGKEYAGSTNNIARRKAEHFYYLKNNKHHNQHLQRAFGKDSFDFKIIHMCNSREEASELELKYIQNNNLISEGYNKSDFTFNPATFKISESLKGKKLSEEHKNNLKGPRPQTRGINHL